MAQQEGGQAPFNPAIGIHGVKPVRHRLAGRLCVPPLDEELVKALIPEETAREEAAAGHACEHRPRR